jgi:hypothetical protein
MAMGAFVKMNGGALVLFLRLGLFQTNNSVTIFPLATLAEQVDTLEAFENSAVLFAPAAGSFETVVL